MLPAELTTLLEDLGLDAPGLQVVEASGAIAAGAPLLAQATGGVDPLAFCTQLHERASACLPAEAPVLLLLEGRPADAELAGWRNALWPWLHVVCVYRLGGGRVERETLQGRAPLDGPCAVEGVVLVGRRKDHVLSPAGCRVDLRAGRAIQLVVDLSPFGQFAPPHPGLELGSTHEVVGYAIPFTLARLPRGDRDREDEAAPSLDETSRKRRLAGATGRDEHHRSSALRHSTFSTCSRRRSNARIGTGAEPRSDLVDQRGEGDPNEQVSQEAIEAVAGEVENAGAEQRMECEERGAIGRKTLVDLPTARGA